jgi:hypothetical protein
MGHAAFVMQCFTAVEAMQKARGLEDYLLRQHELVSGTAAVIRIMCSVQLIRMTVNS